MPDVPHSWVHGSFVPRPWIGPRPGHEIFQRFPFGPTKEHSNKDSKTKMLFTTFHFPSNVLHTAHIASLGKTAIFDKRSSMSTREQPWEKYESIRRRAFPLTLQIHEPWDDFFFQGIPSITNDKSVSRKTPQPHKVPVNVQKVISLNLQTTKSGKPIIYRRVFQTKLRGICMKLYRNLYISLFCPKKNLPLISTDLSSKHSNPEYTALLFKRGQTVKRTTW